MMFLAVDGTTVGLSLSVDILSKLVIAGVFTVWL